MWLLDTYIRQTMERAASMGMRPTAEQQAEFSARHEFDGGGGTLRVLSVAGNNAQIEIHGVLTNAPDIFALLFGGGNTTYPEIIAALAAVEADENIDNVTLAIDSPGGTIDGLFDTLSAITNMSKNTKAVISNMGASAAYAIASQADRIEAANPMSRIGSVGIVASFFVSDEEVVISSTEAPNKAPDVTTEEGKAIIRQQLDSVHGVFADAIANGRGTTIDNVNAKYGQGATLIAGEALRRGMIDGIVAQVPRTVAQIETLTDAKTETKMETDIMDLDKLKAEHPATYKAAVEVGIESERDRVKGHAIMGENSGAMDVALAAIKNGDIMTAEIQAEYLSAGMNRSDVSARTADETATADAADNATDATAPGDEQSQADKEADIVAANLAAKLGVTVEA